MDERGVDHRARARSSAWTGSRPARAVAEALREQGRDRRREAAVRALGRALLALRHDRRAAAVAAVVRQRRAAGQGGRRRGARRHASRSTRRRRSRAGTSPGSTTCTTGASAASCGGATASRSGTGPTARPSCVGPGRGAADRRGLDARTRTCSTPGSPPALWPFSTLGWPERHPDLRALLPDQRAGHRLRHPVLLGRPDDDVRPVRDDGHGEAPAVPHRRAARPGARRSAARRCPSRSATSSTRSTGSTSTAPTRCGSPWPAAPTPAATSRSARSGSRAAATSPPSCGTPPASR